MDANRAHACGKAGRALGALAVAWLLASTLGGCGKVELSEVNVSFSLADVSWFEEEQTLFVFYRVDADQGLGPLSQIELAYTTDDSVVSFTPLQSLHPVHTHLAVDCGVTQLCGSTSIKVSKVPRDVKVQLRFHRDGLLTLAAPVTFNVVGKGDPWKARSLLVYGVFDGVNQHVQWRARHQFPTLRNEEVQALGLRRWFSVDAAAYGDRPDTVAGNPYSYGFADACPPGLTLLGFAAVTTTDRARFSPEVLPPAAFPAPVVCALSTVTDALGTFTTAALAQKNPEVRAAFPLLRSPIRDQAQLQFLLHPCQRSISDEHLAMQKQRLLFSGFTEVCIDDWQSGDFAGTFAATLQQHVDAARAAGNDMVLSIVLHHDDTSGAFAASVEKALAQVLPIEQLRSSPRLSGAFVFDSYGHLVKTDAITRTALWCPAIPAFSLDGGVNEAALTACPLEPDSPDLVIGPFKLNELPILPTRDQYLRFISTYTDAQAGETTALSFRAPERTPLSQDIALGPFAEATFFNDETLSAAPTDAFSYCAGTGQTTNAVFISTGTDAGILLPIPDGDGGFLDPDPEADAGVFIPSGVLPLQELPQVQQLAPQSVYDLGLAWDFSYLAHLTYQTAVAGETKPLGFTVAFGFGSTQQAYPGSPLWQSGQFPLDQELTQCTRFCDAPTFDSAGVYEVQLGFASTYAEACYRPVFPVLPGEGFPSDP